MASNTQSALSHDEVWDDSELQTSWNDALEEYKKYHSLAAKGEKAPMLTPLQQQQQQKPITSKSETFLQNGTSTSATHAQHPLQPTATTTPANFIGPNKATPGAFGNSLKTQPQAPFPPLPSLASLPQTLLGSVQDEAMKNIMLSWYYAGYYTGLYDGQQKAWGDMQQSVQIQESETG